MTENAALKTLAWGWFTVLAPELLLLIRANKKIRRQLTTERRQQTWDATETYVGQAPRLLSCRRKIFFNRTPLFVRELNLLHRARDLTKKVFSKSNWQIKQLPGRVISIEHRLGLLSFLQWNELIHGPERVAEHFFNDGLWACSSLPLRLSTRAYAWRPRGSDTEWLCTCASIFPWENV